MLRLKQSMHYFAFIALIISLLIINIPSTSVSLAQAEPNYSYAEVDCDEIPIVDGIDGVTCGFLTVPENRAEPDGNQVRVAVAVIASTSDNPQPDPLVYLEGGPGGSAMFSIDLWVASPVRAKRDIILFDQRGTGFSEPYLGCPEFYEDEEDYDDADVQACHDRLTDDGVDLSQYNSVTSAADVNDLRLALGYDEWNLFGISYGTRLALSIMRYYPEGVRSVVLDSVYPPQVDAYELQAVTFAESILGILNACADDETCNADYPDLEAVFLAVVDELNEEPLDYEYYDSDGEIYDEVLFGDDLVYFLSEVTYLHGAIPYLPKMIFELRAGDVSTFEALLNQEIGYAYYDDYYPPELDQIDWDAYDSYYDFSDSDGLFNSVECAEEIPFNELDEVYDLVEPYADQLEYVLLIDVESVFDACQIWDVVALPDVESDPVVSDIPTLLVAGQFDPVTPPSWAFDTASYLSNGYAYEFPGLSHAVIDGGECPATMIYNFIDEPVEPDASCIDDMAIIFE